MRKYKYDVSVIESVLKTCRKGKAGVLDVLRLETTFILPYRLVYSVPGCNL
jgi:hypothetical protein